MHCPRCQVETPVGADFCPECGAGLARVCPQCGTQNAPTHKFCIKCGGPLVPIGGPTPEVQAARRSPDAERRQLTVMFCDLVGSTMLSERLDPEELREIVRNYQQTSAEVISRFDGTIAQYLGDGLLVYFGYPRAHEDDAQRAVRAGLGIIDRLKDLNAHVTRADIRLAVRIGIHTGRVVVGEVGGGPKREHLALGDTPNIAARLQGLAEPDTVVIGATTQRLVLGHFSFRHLGPQVLKGMSDPIEVFQVMGDNLGPPILDVTGKNRFTPLVGREEEVALLLARWEQTVEGQGQVIVLSGEPGIGKSRLVQVMKDRVTDILHYRLECRCSPYYVNSPLYPVIDLLSRALEWSRDDSADTKLAKLEKGLGVYPVSLLDVVPLLASLLSLPSTGRYPLPPMSPERQKGKTLEAILAVLLAMAAARPTLFIIEDLHWIDPTTLEFLTLLTDQAPTARLLTLLTARPTFDPPWTPRAHLTSLTLNRFPRRQTEQMVNRVTAGKPLPPAVAEQIVAKTDGVPLFVEELTKMVLESGLLREQDDRYDLTGPLPPLAIPSTLQDSLMARLDRLATVKEVAQLGATLGRTFPYDVLRVVTALDEPTLQHELRRLVQAELLYQRGIPPQATYTFKHALVQEAAYQTLLKSTRQQYHQRIARAIETQFPAEAEARPEFVAHHYTEAGSAAEAVPYWQRASQRAVQRSAYTEAITTFGKALAVLATCPESAERNQRELELQVALGFAVVPVKSWADPDAERAFARARFLSERVTEPSLRFRALFGLQLFYLFRAGPHASQEFAEQCVSVAERAKDQDLLVEAYLTSAATSHFLGEFNTSRVRAEQGLSLYDRARHRSHAITFGQDPRVGALYFLSFALWFLGYPEQAQQQARDNVAFARELSHPFSLAVALANSASVCLMRRDWREAQAIAEECLALTTEQGFQMFRAAAGIYRGLALAKEGQPELGIQEIKQGLARRAATGSKTSYPYFLAWLAEACACTEREDDGGRALAEALTHIEKTGEREYEADIWRLKGEFCLMRTPPDERQAEVCFRRAIDIARDQGAKSFELRGATSLARLWQRQGKREEARSMLGEIYGWFTEGFATADLQAAKILLEQLT